MQITSILDGRTDIGDSLSSAKELMMELDDFEARRKVCSFSIIFFHHNYTDYFFNRF